MTGTPRKAMAFKLDADKTKPRETGAREKTGEKSKPASAATERKPSARTVAEVTYDDRLASSADMALEVEPAKPFRFWSAGTILGFALSALLSIALGLWTEALIRDLLVRFPVLGWFALGLAGVAALAMLVLVIRETAGMMRLKARNRLRTEVAEAWSSRDKQAARKAFADIRSAVDALASTAAARTRLPGLDTEFLEARDLIGLAETELLAEPDRQARQAIRNATHRVSVVTAVSPRALVDIAYVVWESMRLIRRIAEIYDARPGSLGFWRLARRVLEHLAVTGTVALGDSLIQQIVGHGVAARLSARLGEGVINGLMTARIGIAAMDVIRPAPFLATAMPTPALFLPDLTGKDAERNKP